MPTIIDDRQAGGGNKAKIKLRPRPITITATRRIWLQRVKYSLPVIAILVLLYFLATPLLKLDILPTTQTDLQGIEIDNHNLQIMDAKFFSVDEDKQPFTLTAVKAIQSQQNQTQYELINPKADLLAMDGSWSAANAQKGIYLSQTRMIELHHRVEFYHNLGYAIFSDYMEMNLKQDVIASHQAVTGQSSRGHFQAEGIRLEHKGNKVTLLGKSKIIMHGERP